MAKVCKVPMIMQMEALECGAACLTMILAYYKKWIPLELVRSECGVSRDGSNALNIVKAGRSYGLEAHAYRYSAKQLSEKASFPAIIHWNFNHFVVLDGFKKDKAFLNDPARGKVSVSMEEFNQSYTGICLEFSPGPSFEPGGKPRSVLEFVQRRLQGTWKPLLLIMLTGLLAAVAGILRPAFTRVFTDNILSGDSPEWLMPFIGAMALLIIFQLIVTVMNEVYIRKVYGELSITSNAGFMWHVLRLPMEFFSQRMAGDIAGRQRSNDTVAETLVSKLAPAILNMILLVVYLAAMFSSSVLLTFVGLATILINMLLAQLITKKRNEIMQTQMRDQGKLDANTVSGIEMIDTIKASGAEDGYFERWSGYQAAVNKAKVKFSRTNQFLGTLPSFLQELSSIIIICLGVWLIMGGEFTAGMLLAFQAFMSSFLSPVNDLIDAGQSIQEMRTSMERIDDVMEYPEDVMETTDENLTDLHNAHKLSGSIELKNVTFGYARLAPPIIENFNLTIKPGSKIALVGASGCGKSTLAKLISGLYEPWEGEILFDGKKISEIPRPIFTGSLAVVDQDVVLFEDTISDNIKMWDSTIEDYEMVMAARDAGIHSDIMLREGGYHYRMSEGGRDFSGGERQRIEIARVLAGDPSILIMDEATSALDARTEYEVTNAVKDRGITCIIIAHRLSTIRDCDEIIVLDRGKAVERGTHEELMAKGGLYTKLVTTE